MRGTAPSPLSEILEVVSVGLPFCAFKWLVGLLHWEGGQPILGAALLALACSDTLFNLANLVGLLIGRGRVVSTCTLSALTLRMNLFPDSPSEYLKELGSAVDMLLSFVLVAGMVWMGRIGTLPPDRLLLWNVAVVLNVLGAGLARLSSSVQRIR